MVTIIGMMKSRMDYMLKFHPTTDTSIPNLSTSSIVGISLAILSMKMVKH